MSRPILSDYQLANGIGPNVRGMTPWSVRAYYERLIDEGKLVVVEGIKEPEQGAIKECSSCKFPILESAKCCFWCEAKLKGQ